MPVWPVPDRYPGEDKGVLKTTCLWRKEKKMFKLPNKLLKVFVQQINKKS